MKTLEEIKIEKMGMVINEWYEINNKKFRISTTWSKYFMVEMIQDNEYKVLCTRTRLDTALNKIKAMI